MNVNQKIPDFEMDALVGGETKKVKASDYRGKWLVLFFYPKDETSVCQSEVLAFNESLSDFQDAGAQVLSCSVQSVDEHRAWQEKMGEVGYPMLSDKGGEAARKFEVYLEDDIATRATFIIDPEGVVKWINVSVPFVARSVHETLRALKALQTDELCQADWKPGEDTLGKA